MKSSCLTWFFVVLVAIAGLALGLLIGWVIWPVEWINASPENLRFEFQRDYMEMAIDSYQVNQNAELARQRYDQLGEKGPAVLASVQANPTWVTSEEADQFTAAVSSVPATVSTEPSTNPATVLERLRPVGWYLALVILLGLVAIVLLVIVLFRLLNARKNQTQVEPVESPAVETIPLSEQATTGGIAPTEASIETLQVAEDEQEETEPSTAEVIPIAPAVAAGLAVDEWAQETETSLPAESSLETSEGMGAAGVATAAMVGAGVIAAVAGSDTGEPEEEYVVAEESKTEDTAGLAPIAAGVAGLEWALEEEKIEPPIEGTPVDIPTVLPVSESLVVEEEETGPQPLETIDTYGKYNLKVIDIEGIGPVYAARLEQLGITTTHGLLQQCATPKGRQQLAEMSGISHTLILEWANHADMMRIRGIGPQWSDLLEMAGVNTVREMAMRNPEHLYQKLNEVNLEKKLVRQLPTAAQVEDWVDQAKELPPILIY